MITRPEYKICSVSDTEYEFMQVSSPSVYLVRGALAINLLSVTTFLTLHGTSFSKITRQIDHTSFFHHG